MAAAIKYHWFLIECIYAIWHHYYAIWHHNYAIWYHNYAIWHHLARIFTEAG